MNSSTREAIIDYLANRKESSTAELSRLLNLSQADIRYHLKGLIAEGLIITSTSPKVGKNRRGRPAVRIRLAPEPDPSSYSHLAHALLTAVHQFTPMENLSVVYSAIADQLLPATQASSNLSLRMNTLISHLNQKKYQARWEANARGPRVILGSCPFSHILEKHPELCALDKLMFERYLRLSVVEEKTFHNSGSTSLPCIFQCSMK